MLRMMSYFISSTLLAVFVWPAAAPAQDVPPELLNYPQVIFHNGNILTVNESFATAQAVAVRDGKFLAVGSDAEVMRLKGPDTKLYDLKGRMVIPGFVATDADNDMIAGNLYKETLIGGKVLGTQENLKTKKDLIEAVKRYVETRPAGEPIYIRPPDEAPDIMAMTRADLDPISPRHPVAINTTSFDMVVNTLMLNQVAAGTPGGVDHPSIVKDASGKPNGQIYGHAMGVAGWDLRPWPKIDEAALNEQKEMFMNLHRRGITSMVAHTQGYALSVVNTLYHRDDLTMRVYVAHDFLRQNPNAEAYLRRLGNLVDFGLGDMVQIVGAGLAAMDGNADTGSALTLQPKVRSGGLAFPGHGQNTWIGYGPHKLMWGDANIDRSRTEWNNLLVATRYGWNSIGIHNVGDLSTKIWLEGIEAGLNQQDMVMKPTFRPFGLDHNLFWDPSLYPKMEELDFRKGLGKMWQNPANAAELYGDRIHDVQPVPELIKRGFKVHIEGVDPWEEMQHYITRKDDKGRVWGPDHAIDRPTALRMKTIWAARYIDEDKNLGSIEKGKRADMAVLGADFLTVPDSQIEKVPVTATVVGGKVVYGAL
jgi:predicted amidohydrolase YtcJ